MLTRTQNNIYIYIIQYTILPAALCRLTPKILSNAEKKSLGRVINSVFHTKS